MTIFELNYAELEEVVKRLGFPSYRAKQIWKWLYIKGATSFQQMLNLPKVLQDALSTEYNIYEYSITYDKHSIDGTRKWLIKFHDSNEIETVYIPSAERSTLCISSQVGCVLNCSFCHTGTQKLVRNLSAGEIVMQFMHAKQALDDFKKNELRNIVMMGMGEPLYNYENVKKALLILMHDEGIGLSKRKITLSTSGVVPYLESCSKDLGVNLAISLHATKDELRDVLVPLNRKYNIEALLNACRNYYGKSKERKVTFEYVMLDNVNDSPDDALRLVKLIKGIRAKINLIPFNKWPGAIYKTSSKERIDAFAAIVEKAGYKSPVRTPRGEDIMAACGQLKSESLKNKAKTDII